MFIYSIHILSELHVFYLGFTLLLISVLNGHQTERTAFMVSGCIPSNPLLEIVPVTFVPNS